MLQIPGDILKKSLKILYLRFTKLGILIAMMKEDKYAFEVDLKANKPEIKKAIEELFKVNVVGVHTMIVHGKVKRMGRFEGKRPNWKKAIVSLKKGEKIEFFETV